MKTLRQKDSLLGVLSRAGDWTLSPKVDYALNVLQNSEVRMDTVLGFLGIPVQVSEHN